MQDWEILRWSLHSKENPPEIGAPSAHKVFRAYILESSVCGQKQNIFVLEN